MSFWKDVGNFLDDVGSTSTDAFSTAVSFVHDNPAGQALWKADNPILAVPGGNHVAGLAVDSINELFHATVDHPVAAYGNVISDPNELGVFNFFSPSKVEDAWNRSIKQNYDAGQSISGTLAGKDFADTPAAAVDREQYFNSWSGKLSSGAADFAIGWYADPLVVGGKAAKVSRELKTGIKSNEERKGVLDYAQGRTNAAQAGKRNQKLGDRFNAMIASTDDKSASEIAQVPALRSSADAGALAYLFERANLEHAGDEAARHQAKRDVFAAALGDPRAIDKLKSQRSELASEMERLATPPAPTRFDEHFTWDDHGQGALNLFNEATDPLDQRLVDQIGGKIEKLDRAVAASGTTSKIASVGAEKQVQDFGVKQGWIYSGMAGRPVRVVSSALSQRLPGYVSLKDPVAGFGDLKQTLSAMHHTAPDVRTDLLDRYVRASSAGERRAVVADAESRMVNDTAEHYGVTREAAGALLQAAQGRRGTYLKTLSGRLYSSTDAEKWISLVDPETDELLALSKPLARSQIEDMHPIMDPKVVDQFLKVGTHQRAVELFAQRFGSKAEGAATKIADNAGTLNHWSSEILRAFTSRWKDVALFRLAYPARVQVDTQMRLMTQMGALQYLSAMRPAIKGQAKYLLQGELGDGKIRRLFRAPEDLHQALKGTLMKGGTYRGFSLDPARDEEELKRIADHIFKNDGSMADLISEVADTDLRKVRQSGDWGLVQPDDKNWATAYSRAVNRQVRNSPTMMQALRETDNQALKRWVLGTKEGQLEWRELKPGWKKIDDWIGSLREHVDHYVPDEIKPIVSERGLTGDDIERFFGGKASANRMRVHGEAFNPNSQGLKRVGEKYNEFREGWFRWASEAPETIMGRSPMYGHMFETHVREQIDRLADEHIDIEAIRRNADRLARRDVGKVLFDTSHTSNMATHFRLLSPFFAAWEDTMKKWGKLIYDDPSRGGRLLDIWHAPNNMGLVVDSEGNRVDAHGGTYNAKGERVDNTAGYRGNGQYIVVPLTKGLQKWSGLHSMRVNKDSFNVVFQGEPWWLPGFGPLVQVPANEIVRRAFPAEVDDPLVKYVLPFGVTDDSIPAQFAPSWLKQARNAFGNTDDYANTYKSLLAQEYVRYNLGERKSLDGVEEDVAKKTRNWFILRAVSANASPVTATPTPRFQFYIDQSKEYRRKYGEKWQEKFANDFPDYYEMAISLSANTTGINASEKAFDATKRYKSLIAQNPEYGWMFVGPANDPAQPFNQGVYTWQGSTPLSGATDKTYRTRKDPGEALADIQSQKGWIEWQQGKEAINGELQKRGLHSLAQKGAEDLKAASDAFRTSLGAQNPSWLSDYQSRGPDRAQALVRAAGEGIRKDKSLASRSDMKTLQEYLEGRDAIKQVLASRERTSLESNPDIQAAWDAFTASLAENDFGFSQMYSRVLEADDLKGDLSLNG